MRQIPLKILRARLTKELANLPFEITKNGKVVGVVSKGLTQDVPKAKKGLNQNKEFKPFVIENPIPEIKNRSKKVMGVVTSPEGLDLTTPSLDKSKKSLSNKPSETTIKKTRSRPVKPSFPRSIISYSKAKQLGRKE